MLWWARGIFVMLQIVAFVAHLLKCSHYSYISSPFFALGWRRLCRGLICWCNWRFRSQDLSIHSNYSLPLVSLLNPDFDQLSVKAQTLCTNTLYAVSNHKEPTDECSQKIWFSIVFISKQDDCNDDCNHICHWGCVGVMMVMKQNHLQCDQYQCGNVFNIYIQ